MAGENLGDRHSGKILKDALHGFPLKTKPLNYVPDPNIPQQKPDTLVPPVAYGFRSFDRQWILPDKRLINRPNPDLWERRSENQTYLTAFTEESPTTGPALTFTALIPDIHHYKGSFGGRVFPLWNDEAATTPNVKPGIVSYLKANVASGIDAQGLFAYIAAVAANPSYTARFQDDLSTPGLRVPITADPKLFSEAAELGRRILWLHTFGERMADSNRGRPAGPPRVAASAPSIPKEGAISGKPEDMPETIGYDAAKHRLIVGHGFIDNVSPAVWAYEVSGKQVLLQWFSYRKKNRERPIIGDRREPSPLGKIQPDHWLAEYTTELLNVLNVLTLLVELEPAQADLLDRICAGPLISEADLKAAGAFDVPAGSEEIQKDQREAWQTRLRPPCYRRVKGQHETTC